MKVAVVSPYDVGRPGGVQDQVLKLAAWLDAAGHEATVLAPGVPDGVSPQRFVSLGASTLVRANRSAAPVAVSPTVVRRVADAIAETEADVIHLHEPFMPLVGPAVLMGADRSVVATFHADPSPLVRRGYRAVAPLVRRLLRGVEVTAVSPVSGGALPEGVVPTLVPNGIEVDHYRREGIPRRAMRVAFIGRDEPRKGLPDLLTAWPQVRRRLPDAELVVMGTEAPDDVEHPGVNFLGRVDDDTKVRTLRSAAVFCAPNTGGESFGIILAEAMAAGCAVVASAIPGFVHVLADSGALVAPGDPDGLAETLIRLLSDPDELATYADKGSRRVMRFDRPAVLDGYVAAYERAVAGRSSLREGPDA